MTEVIIDTRERDLIRELGDTGAYTVRSLAVGDIWIRAAGAGVAPVTEDPSGTGPAPAALVLERKTLADLEASFFDGRWREQKSRLLTHCAETGARPAYIIEGRPTLRTIRSGGMATSTIRKLLTRLQFRYGIAVLMTDDLADTASLVNILVEQITADPGAFTPPTAAKQYYECVSVNKKANREDPANFARIVLMQCPGISATTADVIIREAGPRLADVFGRDETTLAAIKISEKRKLGPAVAKRLLALWNA